ncbi:hypothetical protein [Oligoflexus tunisiensis]|uniref:hypothetical protein n=1 Tax=Oligoflexus tunisiensis TaxID=708132 RepID=UPI001C4064B5|nr:hypothetical protein [Oligoflexus tunisiensis]
MSSVRADGHWGLESGYSRDGAGGSLHRRELPDLPVETPTRNLTQRDWADFITCGDMLEGVVHLSHYARPSPQFFHRIDADRITVFTPYFAGVDRLRCQRHTFGIKYKQTETVCYMAIPYRSHTRRPETWGYHYTASGIGSWWNGKFASGGRFQFFHQVDRQIAEDARRFPDEIIQPLGGSTNFMNQKVIPFQLHPRAQDLWGPKLSLDQELVPLFIRNLTQMATIADPEISVGSDTTIDQIQAGLDTCESAGTRVGLKALPKVVAALGSRLKPGILAQKSRNAMMTLKLKPLQRKVRPKEILSIEAILINESPGSFDTDPGSSCSPHWSVLPKGFFTDIGSISSCVAADSDGLALGARKNLKPWPNRLTIGPGVVRSFLIHLRVNEFAKAGELEFSLSFGRRNPIRSAPQKVFILGERESP